MPRTMRFLTAAVLCLTGSSLLHAAPLTQREVGKLVKKLRQGEVRNFQRAFANLERGGKSTGYTLVKTNDPMEPERLFKKGTERTTNSTYAVKLGGELYVQTSTMRQEAGKPSPTKVVFRFAPGLRLDGKSWDTQLRPIEYRVSSNGASADSRLSMRFYDGAKWHSTAVSESDGNGMRDGKKVERPAHAHYEAKK